MFNPGDEAITLNSAREGIRCGYIKPTYVETEVVSETDLLAEVGVDLASSCGGELPEHLEKLFVENLNDEEKSLLKQKLIQYQHVFSKGENDLGTTHLVQHKILTKTKEPIKERPRPRK